MARARVRLDAATLHVEPRPGGFNSTPIASILLARTTYILFLIRHATRTDY